MNETDFLNNALLNAGLGMISSINDNSVQAKACKALYEPLRQSMLRLHHWNFAETRAQLAQVVGTPTFEFAFAYQLPSGFLKLKEYNGEYVVPNPADPNYWMAYAGKYKIEGDKLYTNDAMVLVVFVQDITEPSKWDSLFFQALASMLASKLARGVGKDMNKADALQREAMSLWLPIASAVDGQEGSQQAYIADDLIIGR